MRPKLNLRLTLTLSLIAAGIVPMLVSGVIVNYQAGRDLHEITAEKLRGDLVNRESFLEAYLETVVDQAASMAAQPWLSEAMRRFDGSFDTAGEDLSRGAGMPDPRTLRSFYERDFLGTLQAQGGDPVGVERLLPRSDSGLALQHHFIAASEHPLGEKD